MMSNIIYPSRLILLPLSPGIFGILPRVDQQRLFQVYVLHADGWGDGSVFNGRFLPVEL